MSKFFQQWSDERRRKMIAQYLANEQWDMIRSVLERDPELAKRWGTSSSHHHHHHSRNNYQPNNNNGWTLLHSLAYHPATPNDLIGYVAQLDHSAFSRQNSVAETPLHLCCDRARPDWARIRLLLSSLTTTNHHHHHPYRHLQRGRSSTTTCCTILEDGLLLRDNFGRTSFFLACANNAPLNILKDFICINRSVVTVGDIFSEHPIDCLASRLYGQSDPMTLEPLLEKITYCAMEAWKFRPTCPWWDICPENSRDYLLLAILHLRPALLDVMLRVCPIPSSLWKQDGQGNLPIHVALRQPRAPHYILPELVRLAPDTARVPSGGVPPHHKLLPLHLAVRNGRCAVDPFLHAYPEALSQLVTTTGLLPYQDAALRDESVNVIYTLLRNKPDLLSSR